MIEIKKSKYRPTKILEIGETDYNKFDNLEARATTEKQKIKFQEDFSLKLKGEWALEDLPNLAKYINFILRNFKIVSEFTPEREFKELTEALKQGSIQQILEQQGGNNEN